MRKPKVGNKDFKVTVCIILLLGAIAIVATGCGGGGGGGVAPAAVASDELASITMLAPTGPISSGLNNITLQGSTSSGNTVNCMISDFGDGSQNQTQWIACNGSDGASFNHTYSNSTANNVIKTITAKVYNGKNVTTKTFQITVLAAAGGGTPPATSPNLTGFSCENDTITANQSIACASNGTCPAGGDCYLFVDFGDGNKLQLDHGVQFSNISHTYATPTTGTDVTYTILVYATNGTGPNAPASAVLPHNIRVRQGAITAPEALRLSNALNFSQVGNDPYHFMLTTTNNASSYVINGTLSTNIDKAYVLTAAGQKTQIN
ncbi:MAG: hypothetical protein PHU42_04060, partial [Patescibacteria group bacterium]|nr:hypothetical protein [Patescibacteria group bacterium]